MSWIVDFTRGRVRILTPKEAAEEGEETLRDWAAIALGGFSWVASYFLLGGFDTPLKRIGVIAAIVTGMFVGARFADWFWKIVFFGIFGGLAFMFVSWVFHWVVGTT